LISFELIDADRTMAMVNDLTEITGDISALADQKQGDPALSIGYIAERSCEPGYSPAISPKRSSINSFAS